VHIQKVDAHEQRACAVDVHVRVVEARCDEAAAGVDDTRASSRQLLDLRGASDGDDAISADGQRFSGRTLRVHRVDHGVDDGEMDRFLCRERHERTRDQDDKPQESVHAENANTNAQSVVRVA
jgi:hypothetical protein